MVRTWASLPNMQVTPTVFHYAVQPAAVEPTRSRPKRSTNNTDSGTASKRAKSAQLVSDLPPVPESSSWVSCDACSKWRRVSIDGLPNKWSCSENLDTTHSACSVPQEMTDDEIDRELSAAEDAAAAALEAAVSKARPRPQRRRHRSGISRARTQCRHGREPSLCKQCGGRGLCEHDQIRCRCKECGGASICDHGRERTKCKECGGVSICEHERVRSQCKECGGASVCKHGRRSGRCKDCGGRRLCEHGKQHSKCKECGGSSVCQHGRQRSKCKECGGSGLCPHGRQGSACKDCARAYIGRSVEKYLGNHVVCLGTVTEFRTTVCKYTIRYSDGSSTYLTKTQLTKALHYHADG